MKYIIVFFNKINKKNSKNKANFKEAFVREPLKVVNLRKKNTHFVSNI
jgi:hypothetical protein